MTCAVEVKNIKKKYQVGEVPVFALAGVSFQIQKGECVAVVGESGSGKSTLLHILGTLDSPSEGQILIGGENPFSGNDKQISRFRNRHVGFVFQQNNLLPEFNALENVMMPGLIAGLPARQVKERACQLLDRVQLSKRRLHFPSQLSGGEQQRVAIARALINEPLLVLADEPSGSLDSKNAALIHALLKEINETLHATILIVTHNQDFASSLKRNIHMRDGLIITDTYLHIETR